MSKLLDRLERISRGPTTTIGFGAGSRTEKTATMALLGSLSDQAKAVKVASTLAKVGVDGALIEGMDTEEINGQLAQALNGIPWGLRVHELTGEEASRYKGQGCDFLAFGPEKAHLEALDDEDTGYLLCIQPDTDERSLGTIEDLPVDAVLLPMMSIERPLTIQHLMTIGSVRNAFSKFLLVEVSGDLSAGELERLRDVGVDGLVVDATALSAKKLEGLKERLLSLPKRQRSRSGKPIAFLPRTAFDASSVPSDEEEEE